MIFKLSTAFVFLASFAVLDPVKAAPLFVARQDNSTSAGTSPSQPADFVKQNGLDAQKLNARFATINATDACTGSDMACINGDSFAQCVGGKWALQKCSGDLRCYALPLVNKAGTSLACDTDADAAARFTTAGVSGGTDGLGTSSSSSGNSDDNGDVEDCDDSGDPEVDEEDLPYCDDEDAFSEAPTSTTSAATSSQSAPATTAAAAAASDPAHSNYRRQASTIATLPPLGSAVAPLPGSPTVTSNPIVTPTVVIGSDGIVTVTVVSTVTVAPTNCAATIASSSSSAPVIAPTPITVVSAIVPVSSILSSSSIASIASTTAATSATAATQSPVSTITLNAAGSPLSFTFGTFDGTAAAAAPTSTDY